MRLKHIYVSAGGWILHAGLCIFCVGLNVTELMETNGVNDSIQQTESIEQLIQNKNKNALLSVTGYITDNY